MRAGRGKIAGVLLSAGLAGAAGLALESLALGCLGLVVGQSSGALWGLATWLASWAAAAWLSGRRLSPSRRTLAVLGVLSIVAAPTTIHGLLALGRSGGSPTVAWGLGLGLLALPALLQGALLPQLLRLIGPTRRGNGAALVLGANLAGGVAGVLGIAHHVVGAAGRPAAAWVAGACAGLAAGLAARFGSKPAHLPEEQINSAENAEPDQVPSSHSAAAGLASTQVRAGLAWALLTGWMVASQWALLRVASITFGGMQPALTSILLAAPLALAIGAGPLALLLLRMRAGFGLALVLGTCGVIAAVQPMFVSWVEAAGDVHRWVGALVLCFPILTPLGALLPLLHARVRGERGRALGDLLGWEVLGALAFVPGIQALVLPAGGMAAVLGLGPLLAALAYGIVHGVALWRPARLALTAVLVGAGIWTLQAPSPVLATSALTKPEFERLAFDEDSNFAVTVVQDQVRAERTLLTDDFRATATGADYQYMRVLGHLPLLLHPGPSRVGVLAFGTGTTAGAVSLHTDVEEIHVFELSEAVLRFAPYFHDVNHGVLGDPRTVAHVGDGRRGLRDMESGRGLDVLTMEPLLPDSPFGVYLYTTEFYTSLRRTLAPNGLLCQWVPPHALRPETFDAVVGAFTDSFPWSGVFLFGTQVILIGGEQAPDLAPSRFPKTGPAAEALQRLGLEDPEGLAARFVCSQWTKPARPLTDADPWVLFAPKASGREIVSWLPQNLARLRAQEQDPPATWLPAFDAEGMRRRAGVRALHRAREVFERTRFGLPGAPGLGTFAEHAGVASDSLEDDPEWQQLTRMAVFETRRSEGLGLLRAGQWLAAQAKLVGAAEQYPDRADVHLYVALASDRAGDVHVALGALRRSLELCPRILETRAARMVDEIGFSPALVQALGQLTSGALRKPD